MASDSTSLSTLASLCDECAVNSGLLFTSYAAHADRIYGRQSQYIRYTRILSGLCLVSACVAGGLGYFRYAKLHRVWRLRNPKTAAQYANGAVLGAAFSITGFLFLVSPVGFMATHAHGEAQARVLDARAFACLTLQQDYATLHALCTLKAANHPAVSQSWWWWGGRGLASDLSLRRAMMSVNDLAYTEVVLQEENSIARAEGEGEMASTSSVMARGNGSPGTGTDSALARVRAKLSEELLLPSDHTNAPGSNSGEGSDRSSLSLVGRTPSVNMKKVHYNQASSPAELLHCYSTLNKEWARIVAAQTEIAPRAL